jgi:hypothetical protein
VMADFGEAHRGYESDISRPDDANGDSILHSKFLCDDLEVQL